MNELRQPAFEGSAHKTVEPNRREITLPFELANPQQSGGELPALVAVAMDRLHQMGEAIRATEARARAVEAQAREVIKVVTDKLMAAKSRTRAAQAQAQDAEQRASRAELRAEEAEGWLHRLSEAIASALTLPSSREADPDHSDELGFQEAGTLPPETNNELPSALATRRSGTGF